MTTVLIALLTAVVVGCVVVSIINRRISNISIRMPKIRLDSSALPPRDHEQQPSPCQEDFEDGTIKRNEDISAKGATEPGPRPASSRTDTPQSPPKTVGCQTDADCNVVDWGDGQPNVCKADGTCHCVSGSGMFCHYGPTNYKDPKDMTPAELRTFKRSYRSNFTLQDYKNWLLLFVHDRHHLREHHRENLELMLSGAAMTDKHLPALRKIPPLEPAEYFAKMYDGAKVTTQFPNESDTGPLIPSNYDDYGTFVPPEYTSRTWVTNIADLYENKKVDAHELNYYVRPETRSGIDEEAPGTYYHLLERERHDLADLRQARRSGLATFTDEVAAGMPSQTNGRVGSRNATEKEAIPYSMINP